MSDSSVRQPPSVPTVAFSFSHSLRGAAKLGEIKIYRIHDQSFAILSFADISTVFVASPCATWVWYRSARNRRTFPQATPSQLNLRMRHRKHCSKSHSAVCSPTLRVHAKKKSR